MSIHIIRSNKLPEADAIIRPFCTYKAGRIFIPKTEITNSPKDLFRYEIRSFFPASYIEKGKTNRFRKRCIRHLKAAAKNDCKTVVLDLKLPNNLNGLQKIVYNEALAAATAFIAKTDMDILLSVGEGIFTLSDPVLLSKISKAVEEHFGRQTVDFLYENSNYHSPIEYHCTQPYQPLPCDDKDYFSDNFLSHKDRSFKCYCINNDDVTEMRISHNDNDNDDDCSFIRLPPEKKYVVDCFSAREAQLVQDESDEDELCFITDYEDDCFSFDGETEWDSDESKYQDSDIDSPDNLNSNRHFSTYEINNIVKAITDKYNPNEYFRDKLIRHLNSKGVSHRTFYTRAHISRQTWSKIKNDPTHRPDKKTIISFAFVLELTLDETQELLNSVGLTLSDCFVFDFIVMYFLKNRIYNISALNEALYDLKQETLQEAL